MGDGVGSKGGQEGCGSMGTIFVPNYNGVTDSCEDCVIIEGSTEYFAGAKAGLKDEHVVI